MHELTACRTAQLWVLCVSLMGCPSFAQSPTTAPAQGPSAVDAPRTDVERILEQACIAITELKSIRMLVRSEYAEGMRQQPDIALDIRMTSDGPLHVQANQKGEPVAIIASDGRTTREWNAAQKQWTEYPASGPLCFVAGQSAVRFAVGSFGRNWLTHGAPFCAWFEKVGGADSEVRTEEREGHSCVVLIASKSQQRDQMTMRETISLALDANTHLPVQEVQIGEVRMEGNLIQRATITRTYETLEMNPKLRVAEFRFEAPEGSQYVDVASLRTAPGVQVGDAAPAATFATLDGDSQRALSKEYQARPVVLVFWATWCLPCKQEFSDLQELLSEEEFANDVSVLAVAVDQDMEVVESFLERRPIPFIMLYDNSKVRRQFGGDSVPDTFLIDSKGIVRGRWTGWSSGKRADERLAEIRSLLLSMDG